ncbi:type IV secretion system protein [Methylocystis sp. IM3]|uniref:type IV secretion system protein n=1 Tax=unclassified Methylocystis TaxID=2625913 RepID=UPI0030FAD70A
MDIISALFQKVDTVAASAVQQIYQSISSGLAPVFTVALTIYVAYWGYEMIYGRAPLTAGAFLWRIFRIGAIYTLAFSWGDFSSIVVDVFTKGADGVATAVCSGVGGTNCGTPENSISSTLSTLFTNALTAGKTVAASGGWGAAIGLSLLAIVLLIAAVVFITIAVSLVLVGKIALFVLLGLGPLFIAMALFNFSSVLFTGWLRTCAQYAIVPVVVYGILGFLLTLMNSTITNLGSITDASSAMTVIAPFLILCGVGSALLPLSLQIAASVAGGYALRDVIDLQGRAQGAWRLWRDWRGNDYRQTALPPPSGGGYSIGPGGATVQRGYDPRAEQVAAALIESRAAQLRREQR